MREVTHMIKHKVSGRKTRFLARVDTGDHSGFPVQKVTHLDLGAQGCLALGPTNPSAAALPGLRAGPWAAGGEFLSPRGVHV